ncbi:MAG: hypothetical protein V1853_04800 [bacterium]
MSKVFPLVVAILALLCLCLTDAIATTPQPNSTEISGQTQLPNNVGEYENGGDADEPEYCYGDPDEPYLMTGGDPTEFIAVGDGDEPYHHLGWLWKLWAILRF